MLTHNLGYPRVGSQRELKWATEKYWAGKLPLTELQQTAARLRQQHWQLQQEAGLDLVPCNDFSYYDHVLDTSLLVGNVPARYRALVQQRRDLPELDLYFAMARGYQQDGVDLTALEMTKWFDTNYHYLVPEFTRDQQFELFAERLFTEVEQAQQVLGHAPKPVLLGPVSYLLLGKEKEEGFHRLDLLPRLLPVYEQVLQRLRQQGVAWVQLDEPYLALDLTGTAREAYQLAYARLVRSCPGLQVLLATYFEGLRDNIETALKLPIHALHLDLVRAPEQLAQVLPLVPSWLHLSLGVVDGRNIWKTDYQRALDLVNEAVAQLGPDRVLLAPSCSLLHAPADLDLETDEATLPAELKSWLAFAKQKLKEVQDLRQLATAVPNSAALLTANQAALASRRASARIHRPHVQERMVE